MKWKCLQFLLEKCVISFKAIDGIVWYSIEDLCFSLNYEPHSYRQIYRRMPDHLKSKQNIEPDSFKKILRCCVTEDGCYYVLQKMRNKRKNVSCELFIKNEQYRKNILFLRFGWIHNIEY